MVVYFGTFNGGQVRYWGKNDTWFVSYENLPEQIKNAIAVLNIVETRERIQDVGTRFKQHYELDGIPDAVMRGRNDFEETLDAK
jgi:hypothetical protein